MSALAVFVQQAAAGSMLGARELCLWVLVGAHEPMGGRTIDREL